VVGVCGPEVEEAVVVLVLEVSTLELVEVMLVDVED